MYIPKDIGQTTGLVLRDWEKMENCYIAKPYITLYNDPEEKAKLGKEKTMEIARLCEKVFKLPCLIWNMSLLKEWRCMPSLWGSAGSI